jgi:hypothetical protein
MSALDAVSAVWTRLKTIEGVGPNVYNMLREATTDAAFKAIFVDATTDPTQPIVRAWRVTRVATAGKDSPFMNAESDTHNVEISGFMSYQDGVSEPVIQQVIENIRLAFNPLGADGSAARRFVDVDHPQGQFDWSGPLQIVGPRLGMLGSVLVHAVLMNYPVTEFPL